MATPNASLCGVFYWGKMKTLSRIIGAVVALATVSPCAEALMLNGMDLDNCRFADGRVINQPLCGKLRISEENFQAKKEKARVLAAERSEIQRQDNERREAEKVKFEESNRAMAEQRGKNEAALDAKWDEEKKKRLAEEAQEEREERSRQSRRNADIKSKKELCGGDFASPKIGMTLDRAQQCVSKLRLTSQANRTDGVVSMYSGGGFYLQVMDGRIVYWTR